MIKTLKFNRLLFFGMMFAFLYFFTSTLQVHAEEPNVVETETDDTVEKNENTGDVENTVINIEKQDEEGNQLSGAELQIIDSNGTVREKWISDGTIHQTTLPKGQYTLHESTAPDDYEIGKDVPFTVDEPINKTQTDLIAYQNWGVHKDYSYRIITPEQYQEQIDTGTTGLGDIVYCLNQHLTYPQYNTYTRYEGTNGIIQSVISADTGDINTFIKNLKRVMYYGYGSDASGHQEKYGLTDLAFRKVTQYAVWYFTDNLITNIPDKPSSHGSYMIYQSLVYGDMEVPDDLMMYIYIANDHQHQSLVGVNLYQPLTIVMVNSKATVPVTPKQPEHPEKHQDGKIPQTPIKEKVQSNAENVQTASNVNGGTTWMYASMIISFIAILSIVYKKETIK